MISVNNQFEPIPAFEILAGCSIGNCTQRSIATDLLMVLDTCSEYDCSKYWRDIAKCDDDDQYLTDVQSAIIENIQEYCPLPDYCTIEMIDNEWRVQPYIDDDLPRLDDIPDNLYYLDGQVQYDILIINDHGNTTLMQWNDTKREYETIWDMV